jgi:hypothetical protein
VAYLSSFKQELGRCLYQRRHHHHHHQEAFGSGEEEVRVEEAKKAVALRRYL